MDLSIVIVNYNTYGLTKNLIDSIIATVNNLKYEIYIVDNASEKSVTEQLLAKYSETRFIHLIFNTENLGFSKANNIALKQCKGRYILLINSDTIVKDDCIENCLSYIQTHSNIGALGCKLLLPKGSLDHACKRGFPTPSASLYYFLKLHKLFPNSKRFGAYTMSYMDDNSIGEVDSLTGAFMLLPNKVIQQVGLLDEDFFMYGEDLDWCYRIKKAGYTIVYYPEAVTIHLKGQSSKKKKNKTIYEFHRAMILFYKKHYQSKYPIIVTLLLYLSIYLKMGLSYFVNLFK